MARQEYVNKTQASSTASVSPATLSNQKGVPRSPLLCQIWDISFI